MRAIAQSHGRKVTTVHLISCRRLGSSRIIPTGSFFDAIREFFDHGVRQNLAGDALNLCARGVAGQAIGKRKSEILALAYGRYLGKSNLTQGVLDGLALWIEDRCLQS